MHSFVSGTSLLVLYKVEIFLNHVNIRTKNNVIALYGLYGAVLITPKLLVVTNN